MKGAYVLILRLERPVTIRVGALGEIRFEAGNYAYVRAAPARRQAPALAYRLPA